MYQELLEYSIGPGAEAFTTRRESVLPCTVIQGHQLHGDRIAVIDRPDLTKADLEGYDAFICRLPGVAIGVRTADCVPVLLYDPVRRGRPFRLERDRTEDSTEDDPAHGE